MGNEGKTVSDRRPPRFLREKMLRELRPRERRWRWHYLGRVPVFPYITLETEKPTTPRVELWGFPLTSATNVGGDWFLMRHAIYYLGARIVGRKRRIFWARGSYSRKLVQNRMPMPSKFNERGLILPRRPASAGRS